MENINKYLNESIFKFGKNQSSYKKNDYKYHIKEIIKSLIKAFKDSEITDISNIKDIDKWENDIIKKANDNGFQNSLKLLYLNWAYTNFNYKDIENIKLN